MGTRRKVRYKSKGIQGRRIALSGRVFVRHMDEDDTVGALKEGDVCLFLSTENTSDDPAGDYFRTGRSGYLRGDIYDGKDWKPLLMEEFFPGREQYFTKSEQPADTCRLVGEMLRAQQGTLVRRTYREHYVLLGEEAEAEEN